MEIKKPHAKERQTNSSKGRVNWKMKSDEGDVVGKKMNLLFIMGLRMLMTWPGLCEGGALCT